MIQTLRIMKFCTPQKHIKMFENKENIEATQKLLQNDTTYNMDEIKFNRSYVHTEATHAFYECPMLGGLINSYRT